MNNKKYVMILFFVVLILSLNAYSATTTNSTDSPVKELQKTNNDMAKSSNKMVKTEVDNIVYVNASSESTQEDGSQESPYKTINNENLEKISSNSTIYVSKGTYNINSTEISIDLSIIGEDKNQVVFIPNENNSVFTINPDINVLFNNFTLQDFSSETNAAITNDGNLIIENLNLKNNVGTSSTSRGGSIYNTGNLKIVNTTFVDNVASWGAAVYNTKNTDIINSKFNNNHIYNVGGALYNLGGNLTIYDSRFSGNKAVSGAAIYNNAGYSFINNTEFYKNDAEKFYGGAIYSTGITITNNSQFYLNHATKDGGAITNTNNFTIINCIFEQNSAGENGGTIENVPWSSTQNGNLTIINSSFIENSANGDGGVIINYDKPEYGGDFCTVTVRDSLFSSNNADGSGGVIYNQQYMDFQNCVFVNNIATKNSTISSDSKLIKSIDYNWWGTNTPKKSEIGAMPKVWRIMKFTNTTPLVTNLSADFNVSLNTLNNGKTIDSDLQRRAVLFYTDDTGAYTYAYLKDSLNVTLFAKSSNVTAKIDNQLISLKAAKLNVTYSLLNKNQTLQIKLKLPSNVKGDVILKINSITILNKTALKNGSLTYKYNIPVSWSNAKYRLGVKLLVGSESLYDNSTVILIPKRNVTAKLSIINTTQIKAGKTIKLVATVKLGKNNVTTGTVSFKINGKTIKSKVKISNGKATITYKIPENFTPKTYNISVIYSGDNNKNSATATKKITLAKQNVHSNLKSKITVSKNSSTKIVVKLLDENNNKINYGKICYKYNGKTVKTNISMVNGFFTFTFNPKIFSSNKVTLSIAYGENSKYTSLRQNVQIIIK